MFVEKSASATVTTQNGVRKYIKRSYWFIIPS